MTTVLFLFALAFNVSPYLRGSDEWRWHFGIPGRQERHLIPTLTLASGGKRTASTERPARRAMSVFLAAMVLWACLTQAILFVTAGSVLEPLFCRTVPLLSSGVFSVGSMVNDAASFLCQYPDLMSFLPWASLEDCCCSISAVSCGGGSSRGVVPPDRVRRLRGFLGSAVFYRRHRSFALIAALLAPQLLALDVFL